MSSNVPASPTPRKFSFERASVWSLIVTVGLALVVWIPSASVPFLSTKTFVLAIGAIITLAFYILARLTRGNLILPPVALLGAMWLPVIAYALSGLFSGVGMTQAIFGTTLETDTLGFIAVAVLLGTLAALALRHNEQYQTFFRTLGIVLCAVVVVQIIFLLVSQVAPSLISPTFSLIGTTEDLTTLLGLGLISALITLRLAAPSSRTRMLLHVGGALALLLLAVFNDTLAWTLVALAAFALFVEAVMQRAPAADADDMGADTEILAETEMAHAPERRSLVAPLVVLVVALFFLIGSTLGNALAGAFHASTLSVRPSWQSTLAVGSKVYHASPIFGSGPGTFGAQWVAYRDASLNQTVFWNVDFTSGIGFVPTSFVTTGALGALAWILFFATFLFFGIRALLFRAADDAGVRLAAVLSFVGAAYLFTVAIWSVPSASLLVLGFVLVGVCISTLRFAKNGGQWGISFARNPRVGFVVVFVLTLVLLASIVAAYSFIERYAAQVNLARASAALSAGDLDGASAALARSIAFAPSAAAYQGQAQIAGYHLQQIAASTTLAAADAQKLFQDQLSTGINAALTATRVAPSDYQSWMLLGDLYATVVPFKVEGAYDNAKTAYEKALALNPTNPTIDYALAQLAVANKDTAGAEEYLKQAITLKQDYTAAIFLLSQLEVADGNLKDALASAEAAAYFTPNDQNVLFQLGLLRAASNDTDGAITALSAAVAVNAQFANARYFLAAAYAKKGDYASAEAQLKAISDLSADNAKAVAGAITTLEGGKNPFPANLLSASSTPVTQ